MAATKQGIASWGVTGSATGVTGIITSIEDGAEYIMAPDRDLHGRSGGGHQHSRQRYRDHRKRPVHVHQDGTEARG